MFHLVGVNSTRWNFFCSEKEFFSEKYSVWNKKYPLFEVEGWKRVLGMNQHLGLKGALTSIMKHDIFFLVEKLSTDIDKKS